MPASCGCVWLDHVRKELSHRDRRKLALTASSMMWGLTVIRPRAGLVQDLAALVKRRTGGEELRAGPVGQHVQHDGVGIAAAQGVAGDPHLRRRHCRLRSDAGVCRLMPDSSHVNKIVLQALRHGRHIAPLTQPGKDQCLGNQVSRCLTRTACCVACCVATRQGLASGRTGRRLPPSLAWAATTLWISGSCRLAPW